MTAEEIDRPEDLYATLGISCNASPEEISAAFLALVPQFHPDTSKLADPTHRKFKRLVEAYETLSDPKRRRAYDRHRRSPGHGSVSHPRGESSGRERTGVQVLDVKEEDIHAELPVTPEEAKYGGPCEINIAFRARCSACEGQISNPSSPCPKCGNARWVSQSERVQFQIPAGLRSGVVLQIAEHGHQRSPQTSPSLNRDRARRGTLWLTVVIRPCW